MKAILVLIVISLLTVSVVLPAAEAAGDLGIAVALKSHSVDDISFLHGKMAVGHREHSVG
jgi:hypothetical protein